MRKEITPEESSVPVFLYTPEGDMSAERQGEQDSIRGQRRATLQQEADPLFFKVQRGEATHEEWLAKVEEIRKRFPYF